MLHKWSLAGVAMMAAACTFVYSSEQRADVSISVGAEGGIKAPAEGKVTVDFFYDALSPYGTWVQDQKHGWVWQPQVAVEIKEWRPYFHDGRWILTDAGWFWKSDYEWGWIGFHYGRWYWRETAWVWVPDTTWGPAWVAWRESDKVFGWAPLPPEARFEANVGITFREELPADFFVFVPARSFLSVNVTEVALPRTEVRTVYNQTQVVKNAYTVQNNIVVNRGISAERVTQVTGQQVDTVKIADAKVESGQTITGEKMQGNQLTVYRPQVSGTAQKSEPSAAARESKQQKQSGKMSSTAESREGAAKGQAGKEQARDTKAGEQGKEQARDTKTGREGRSDARQGKDADPMSTSADRSRDSSDRSAADRSKMDRSDRTGTDRSGSTTTDRSGAMNRSDANDSPNRSHGPNEPKAGAPGRDTSSDARRDDRSMNRGAADRSQSPMNTSADRGGVDRSRAAQAPRSDRAQERANFDRAHQQASQRQSEQRSSAQPQAGSRSPVSGTDSAKPPAGSSSDAPRSSAASGADQSGQRGSASGGAGSSSTNTSSEQKAR